MNEQELIIQGNQASALMPKLKRYIDEQITALSGGVASKAYVDEQIAALSEKDKNTLFINFNDVSRDERQILIHIEEGSRPEIQVYTDVYIPVNPELPPEGDLKSIAEGIYDKYHESYPWLKYPFNVTQKTVDGYIVLVPVGGDYDVASVKDTPWLRLGYSLYSGEADIIEQHLGWIRRLLGDDSGEGENIISDGRFLSDASFASEEGFVSRRSKTFCLKGWMLLKNI